MACTKPRARKQQLKAVIIGAPSHQGEEGYQVSDNIERIRQDLARGEGSIRVDLGAAQPGRWADRVQEVVVLKVKPGAKVVPTELETALIAPCGMNCGLCIRYLREKRPCGGCRSGVEGKAKSVLACTISTCDILRASESGFCSDCTKPPCPRLKRLDARYRQKYRMSMLDNLRSIRDKGVEAFAESERERWACPECGGVQCVHAAECIYCGHEWPRGGGPSSAST